MVPQKRKPRIKHWKETCDSRISMLLRNTNNQLLITEINKFNDLNVSLMLYLEI